MDFFSHVAQTSVPLVLHPLETLLKDIVPGKLIENKSSGNHDEEELHRYMTDILGSKVYDVAPKSPLQHAEKISEILGTNIYLKREDKQEEYIFMLRGAYNLMSSLPKDQLEKGVIITAATGNHAQAVALSAQKLNCKSVIVMPTTTPDNQRVAVEKLGGEVILHGDTMDKAEEYATWYALENELKYIPPFDDEEIIIGQGTVGAEIMRDTRGKDIHAVFVPVGGGGLVAGVATYMKKASPNTKIIGVEPTTAVFVPVGGGGLVSGVAQFSKRAYSDFEKVGSESMSVSLLHGKRINAAADGETTFNLCKKYVDGMVLVDPDAIDAAIKGLFEEENEKIEARDALAIAGAQAYCKQHNIQNENIVVITGGAHMDSY